MKGFSIIMPTYNQSHFIRRAINSVLAQTYTSWELIIINDGCTDKTEEYIQDFLYNPHILYLKNHERKGLVFSINKGLVMAKYELIAYLPSDDYFFKDHLLLHKQEYDNEIGLFLTFSKASSKIVDSFMRHNHIDAKRREFGNLFYNYPLQLVQTVHRRTSEKWDIHDEEDDFYKMYWSKLIGKGHFRSINVLSCYWHINSNQEHKIKSENSVFSRNVLQPSKICRKGLNVGLETKLDREPLNILLVGELSHNPDRILALKRAGCELFALWTDKPLWGGIGPIPGVTDIPLNDWKNSIKKIHPDIIYGLLNYMAVPLAYEVLMSTGEIPFVWHFKEGPYVCQYRNMWKELMELYTLSDGRIFINEECRNWFELYIPDSIKRPTLILDGDLPSAKCINTNFSPKLSQVDDEIHVLNSGRLLGLSLNEINYLCRQKIHIHSYGFYSPLINHALFKNPNYFHLHDRCYSKDWVTEYSKYDAGLLHGFQSENYNELVRTSWDDLNIPAKVSTFAIAGLPMIQRNNSGHIVATQRITKDIGCGLFFSSLEDLCGRLRDTSSVNNLAEHIIKHRERFVFETYLSRLIDFFEDVIREKASPTFGMFPADM